MKLTRSQTLDSGKFNANIIKASFAFRLSAKDLIFQKNDRTAESENLQLEEAKELACEKCGQPIDDCKCVCPYCGETVACDCCIGLDKATGG